MNRREFLRRTTTIALALGVWPTGELISQPERAQVWAVIPEGGFMYNERLTADLYRAWKVRGDIPRFESFTSCPRSLAI